MPCTILQFEASGITEGIPARFAFQPPRWDNHGMISPHDEIRATVSALRYVRNPRFLATERGFHGAFYCALRTALMRRGMLWNGRILEMEYQKSDRHGIFQRPDIIYHVPVEESGARVEENNLAVWAIKHRGSATAASEDFEKLDWICHRLRYPLAIFINVGTSRTHLREYCGEFPDRVHAFATPGPSGANLIYAHFEGENLREVEIRL
jgi:hypothetical protein